MNENENNLGRITVLIVAHKRKKFLKQAVLSVKTQLQITNEVDIIVIKNFEDAIIETFLKENCVSSYTSTEEGLGSKLSFGIKKAKGEIVCFLEDDDLFIENKLQEMVKVMADVKVGYYHNNFEVVNEEAKLIPSPFLLTTKANFCKVEINGLKMGIYNRLVRQGATFNLSCVTIRKSILLQHFLALARLNTAIENFLFYLALDSGYTIVIDSQKTTRYRIHGENFSISKQPNLEQFTMKKIEFLKNDIKAYEIILSSITNPSLRKHVQYRTIFPIAAMLILDQRSVEHYSLDKIDAIFEAIRNRSILLAGLVIVSFLTKFFPLVGKVIYYRYDKHLYKKATVLHNYS